jgi:hypothetical protein
VKLGGRLARSIREGQRRLRAGRPLVSLIDKEKGY